MNIIKDLKIETFRGTSDLLLKDLSTINVVVGANNCGKTSVLEAIRLLSAPYSMGTAVTLAFLRAPVPASKRATKIVEYATSLFRKENDGDGRVHYALSIAADIRDSHYEFTGSGIIDEMTSSIGTSAKVFSVSTKIQKDSEKAIYSKYILKDGTIDVFDPFDNSIFPCLYIHSGTNYYHACVQYLSESIINERKVDLIRLLNGFDSQIEDISIVGDDVYIHHHTSGTLPLFVYGTGLQKAVLLAACITSISGGVLLIDEVDNAINISAFKEVFSWFVKSCRTQNVQVFATTHSAETIDSILDYVKPDGNDDIRIITLRKAESSMRTIAKMRNGKTAKVDRQEFEMELRV